MIKVFHPEKILNYHNGKQLLKEVETAITSGVRTVVLNLEDVTFIDSMGLGYLIRIQQRVNAVGDQLALCSPTGQTKMLLQLTDAEHIFEIYADLSAFHGSIVVQS